jgi:hypothetical protein
VLRYLAGLLLATILLLLVLPLVGITQAKMLPPPLVYAKAEGKTQGRITGKEVSPTANPFHVGDHVYLVSYKFAAPAPPARGQTKPGAVQGYAGTVRVLDEGAYNAAQPGGYLPAIRYEKTYPEVNGVLAPEFLAGRSVGVGSNILSGWLLFLLLDLAVAYAIMVTVLERFGRQENI